VPCVGSNVSYFAKCIIQLRIKPKPLLTWFISVTTIPQHEHIYACARQRQRESLTANSFRCHTSLLLRQFHVTQTQIKSGQSTSVSISIRTSEIIYSYRQFVRLTWKRKINLSVCLGCKKWEMDSVETSRQLIACSLLSSISV
jgi:hypothetical protein